MKSKGSSGIVGALIRERREALGISQRALGQSFEPPVTTQFISNIERGVTPLPPTHIGVLARALHIEEAELRAALEREYSARLGIKLGLEGSEARSPEAGAPKLPTSLTVTPEEYALFRAILDAYRIADPKNRDRFLTLCESVIGLSRPKNSSE